MTVERADFDDLVTLVTQAPTWEKDRMGGVRILLRALAEGKGRRAGPDPRPLDVAARPRIAQAAGPSRERRVPGGEAAPRRARQLPRSPARGERRQARQRGARAAAAGGRGAARLGGGLHAARDAADRGCTRAARARCRRSPRALAENLPQPKLTSGRSRRRKRRKREARRPAASRAVRGRRRDGNAARPQAARRAGARAGNR